MLSMLKNLLSIGASLSLVILFSIVTTNSASAHPGRTDSNGGHYCWTNCTSWGEVYGQWHSHSGGSSSSYTPAPSYESTYKSNSDCPSYGFAYLGSCYELPAHARKSFSGFSCDYGYDEVGYGLSKQCLAEVEHGYRIGTSVFCDYGYELLYSSCFKKSTNSSYGSNYSPTQYESSFSCPKNSTEDKDDPNKCSCDVGYEVTKDKSACKKTSKKTNEAICKKSFGKNSLWTGKYDKMTPTCVCKTSFTWNKKGTSCVKI